MNRTTWAWSAATATGILALLLMLAWQLTNWRTIAADEEVVDTSAAANVPEPEPKREPRLAVTLSQEEPTVERQQPVNDFEFRSRGIRLVGRSPFEDREPKPPEQTPPPVSPFSATEPPGKPSIEKQPPVEKPPALTNQPAKSESPFGVQSEPAAPKAKPASVFDLPPMNQAKTESPRGQSPGEVFPTFPPDEKQPAEPKRAKPQSVVEQRPTDKLPPTIEKPTIEKPPVERPFDQKPVARQSTPELPNPFSTPPAAKQAEPARPAFGNREKPTALAKPTAVPAKPPRRPVALSVDLFRVDIPEFAEQEEQFLVTSLGARDRRPRPEVIGIPTGRGSDGWMLAEVSRTRKTIIPTRHGVGMPVSSSIASSASIVTSWAVDAPRLHFEIVAAPRATVGRSLPILLRITNTGTADATGVKLLIDLPETLSYHVGRKLEHVVGRLQPGETRTARLTPKVIAAGPIDLAAVAIGDHQLHSPAERRVDLQAAARSAPRPATAAPRAAGPPRSRVRPASVECYDGQRIILIRR